MSVELYIAGINEDEGGYFQNAYGEMNVLPTLGLDWFEDFAPLCTKKGVLKGKNLKTFRNMVANAEQHIPTAQELSTPYIREFDDLKARRYRIKEWPVHFSEKWAELLAFLDRAIELKRPIYISM